MFNSKRNVNHQARDLHVKLGNKLLDFIDIEGTLKDVTDNKKGFELIMDKYGKEIDDIILDLCNKHCT